MRQIDQFCELGLFFGDLGAELLQLGRVHEFALHFRVEPRQDLSLAPCHVLSSDSALRYHWLL